MALNSARLGEAMKTKMVGVSGGASIEEVLGQLGLALAQAVVEEINAHAEIRTTGTVIAAITGAGGGVPGPIQGTTIAPAQVTLPEGCVK